MVDPLSVPVVLARRADERFRRKPRFRPDEAVGVSDYNNVEQLERAFDIGA